MKSEIKEFKKLYSASRFENMYPWIEDVLREFYLKGYEYGQAGKKITNESSVGKEEKEGQG